MATEWARVDGCVVPWPFGGFDGEAPVTSIGSVAASRAAAGSKSRGVEVFAIAAVGSLSILYRRCDREVNGAPSESIARVSKTVDMKKTASAP